jgi:hypothetical protein
VNATVNRASRLGIGTKAVWARGFAGIDRERRRQDVADAAYRGRDRLLHSRHAAIHGGDVFTAVPRGLDGLAVTAGRTTK